MDFHHSTLRTFVRIYALIILFIRGLLLPHRFFRGTDASSRSLMRLYIMMHYFLFHLYIYIHIHRQNTTVKFFNALRQRASKAAINPMSRPLPPGSPWMYSDKSPDTNGAIRHNRGFTSVSYCSQPVTLLFVPVLLQVSVPAPPFRVLLPSPPISVSLPPSPIRQSLPSPPSNRSSPPSADK